MFVLVCAQRTRVIQMIHLHKTQAPTIEGALLSGRQTPHSTFALVGAQSGRNGTNGSPADKAPAIAGDRLGLSSHSLDT